MPVSAFGPQFATTHPSQIQMRDVGIRAATGFAAFQEGVGFAVVGLRAAVGLTAPHANSKYMLQHAQNTCFTPSETKGNPALKPSQKSTTLEYVIVLRPPDGSAEPENGHAGYAYEPYGCLARIWSNSSPRTDQPNQKMTSLENGKLFRGHMRP